MATAAASPSCDDDYEVLSFSPESTRTSGKLERANYQEPGFSTRGETNTYYEPQDPEEEIYVNIAVKAL